jgi:hypothetical protein
VQRLETNEGGREEEEKGLRVSIREPERLHGEKRMSDDAEVCWAADLANDLESTIGKPMPVLSAPPRKGSTVDERKRLRRRAGRVLRGRMSFLVII